jgi:hypothetical protein
VNHDLSMIIWSRVWYFVSDPHKGYMTGLIIMLMFTMLLWSFLCNFVDRLVGMLSLIGRFAELRRKFMWDNLCGEAFKQINCCLSFVV